MGAGNGNPKNVAKKHDINCTSGGERSRLGNKIHNKSCNKYESRSSIFKWEMSRTRFFTQLGSTQETLIGWLTCLLPYQPRVLLDLLGGFRERTRSVWCRSFASYVEWVIFYQKKPLPFPRAQLTLSQPSMVPEAKPDVVHHPYWPRNLELQNYIPNDRPLWQLLTFFFSILGILLLLTWFVAGWRSKIWGPFGTWRTLIICWFTICAFVHGVIEGWFILYYMEIPGDQSILSQFWKEYSKGDSRYMISDNFIVCLETTNACFLGPFSLWTAVAFLSRQSHRYVLQLVVSVGQLYGDVLYFYTAYRDGFCHGEMWHPIYFWFYFVCMNGPWIIIPSILIWDAWKHFSGCQRVMDANKVKKH